MFGYTEITGAFRIHTLYTAFQEMIGPNYFYAGERHDFWELVIVTEGQIGVTAGEKAWVLHSGQAMLHPPMEFHRIWYSGSPGKILVFSFGANGLSGGIGGGYHADIQTAKALLEQLQDSFRLEGIYVRGVRRENMAAQIAVKRWELYLMELIHQKRQALDEEASGPAKNYAAIIRVLEEHIHESLTVTQIAQLCNMGQASVKQTFSRYAGMGVISYFNRRKVDAAVDMLQSGSSVKETAAALGFPNQNYFSTVFKRIMGKPPTAYK